MLSGFRVVDLIWFSLAFGFLLALCLHRFSRYVPHEFERSHIFQLFQDLIRYGKTKAQIKRSDLLRAFDVPKRWFWHFYTVSVIWNGFLLTLLLRAILLEEGLPKWLVDTLRFLSGGQPSTSTDRPLSVLLVNILLWVHCLRRLQECLFVSVFSDGVMHIVQYAFGLSYYIFLGLTVFCVDISSPGEGSSLLSQLRWYHAAGTGLFLWASWLQHHSLALLASLRTRNTGAVETLAHHMPHGCWFDLVSCPHYFAELLIYVSMALCLGGASVTWWLVVLYVLFNQALAAQLCHEFYQSKFEEYPPQRKAFIPFVL
ncbi:polyprenol reductase isoform X1 [Clupea harengus]|uniref:Polyprenal reductase n=2 Tax=Clupea harengus TaxID=7950 RepID=A0A6P3VPX1_CLUHA|nr:polyprenol reductase isoform X1 [Clupea harengus]